MMTIYEVLHWLVEEASKMAGKTTAAEVHAAISALERGGAPHAVSPPSAPAEEAPAVDQGTAEPSTAEVLAEVLAAIRGQQAAAPAAPEPPAEAPAPPEPTAPVVDPGQAPAEG